MRKGVDSLCGLIRNELGKNPLSGELFIFFCRARKRKVIVVGSGWVCVVSKRLESGTFEMPEGSAAHQPITARRVQLYTFRGVLKM